MECEKKLSIIVPVYNVEKYLKRCIESIRVQCSNNSEIILVDDGSTDNSGMICDDYKKKYPDIFVVIHKKNEGLSSARNKGIESARGEYLFFLDSDDSVVDEFLENIKPKLKSREYDIIEFECCCERKLNQYNAVCLNKEKVISPKRCIENILKNKMGNQICLRIYKKQLFDEIRFPMGRNYEDISVFYKLVIRARKIIHIFSEYYVYNVINENSITKKTNIKNMYDMYVAVNDLCDGIRRFCVNNNINLIYIEYYRRHSYIYILIKLLYMGEETKLLRNEILFYLKAHNHYNLFQYRYYDLKRWAYFQFLVMSGKV